jgi:hypothetical protein
VDPIGTQNQIDYFAPFLPAIPPGPTIPSPAAPGLASVPAPVPTLAEIAVVEQPGATGGTAALPGATGEIAALPGSPLGGSVASPAGSSGEETVDTSAAQRATQQGSTVEGGTEGDAALVVLASSESAGEQTVLCPPGVAPGSSIKRKDAAGKEVTVTCK